MYMLKAFDRIKLKGNIYMVEKKGIPGNIIKVIKVLKSNSTAQESFNKLLTAQIRTSTRITKKLRINSLKFKWTKL